MENDNTLNVDDTAHVMATAQQLPRKEEGREFVLATHNDKVKDEAV